MIKKMCTIIFAIAFNSSLIFNSQGIYNSKISSEIEENEVLTSIAKFVNMEICETGVKMIYYCNDNAESQLKSLLQKSPIKDISSIKNDSEDIYFSNISNYDEFIELQGVDLKEQCKITINYKILNSENSLNKIEEYLQKYTENKVVEAKYFKYLKGKLDSNNMDYYNDQIIKALKKYGATNISSLKISNGITSTAVLKNKYNNKKINLNYSICSYESGTYLLIGTPFLDELY